MKASHVAETQSAELPASVFVGQLSDSKSILKLLEEIPPGNPSRERALAAIDSILATDFKMYDHGVRRQFLHALQKEVGQ